MTNFTPLIKVAVFVFLVSGCAQELNRSNADSYFELGLDAEAQGNYAGARESYWRAWIDTRDKEAPPAHKSAVLFNLGRMTGYTCDFYDARKLLQDALEMEFSLSGPDSSSISKRLLELARLNFDHEQYVEATWFYEKGIQMAVQLGIERSDPIFLANTLDELAQSYEKSEQPAMAISALNRAAYIRGQYPDQAAKFVPVRYPKTCPK